MSEFFYRTEEIRLEEISDYFVETKQDRQIINQLKAVNPIVLVGSRGMGKSFLFRMAQKELLGNFEQDKILPVYLTFRKSSLIQTSNQAQFHLWMMARLCNEILRALRNNGGITSTPASLAILAGGTQPSTLSLKTKIEEIADLFESSWQEPGVEVDTSGIPTIDHFLDAIEDICLATSIRRLVIFIDEAAHVLWPEQQRQFFTLFRDLRSPYITCNAAVYPGVTVYGDTFQPIHDATILSLHRDVQDSSYVSAMRDIVSKQATGDSTLIRNIIQRGQNFSILAYAASGNPRHLLKTVMQAPGLRGDEVNSVIREYYRNDVWAEHSGLALKYTGHREIIDWGRKFVEIEVLPELNKKNSQYLSEDKKTTCYFWMHRDIPQAIKEALRLLEYTGIVFEHASGIRATRAEIGTRYSTNLGCLMALEATPTSTGFEIAKSITPKRMTEYGINYRFYETLLEAMPTFTEPDMSTMLKQLLSKDIEVLDLTPWQREKLQSINIYTVGEILKASEGKLQEAHYIGEKKARRIRNAAVTAVYEYLSG
ncbi:hypothetical protein QWJ34_08175 [Saccharibacillus sp. CPCC 101409]|uniref:ORC-CDC6 family AAA ATPase n=1 Tax=Saccharibacillus sp. CPCC 101409 TaxID=3058041 RepID=UPI002671FFA8|nr:hypothetical protein [Saccharibacillus sp. CPCC 101409]MDO3409737.1 hypothetical protein [Saccharibacillus sp. CPCC 101409]